MAFGVGTDFQPGLLLESVGAMGAGLLLHRATRHRTARLPLSFFFLEEATLGILFGVLALYLLLQLG